jgi:hypothetical protein
METDKQSSEGFYLNEKGERADKAFHDEMLSSSEGNAASDAASIEAAVKAGMDLQNARRLFGGNSG